MLYLCSAWDDHKSFFFICFWAIPSKAKGYFRLCAQRLFLALHRSDPVIVLRDSMLHQDSSPEWLQTRQMPYSYVLWLLITDYLREEVNLVPSQFLLKIRIILLHQKRVRGNSFQSLVQDVVSMLAPLRLHLGFNNSIPKERGTEQLSNRQEASLLCTFFPRDERASVLSNSRTWVFHPSLVSKSPIFF